jgi:hypothetical protein
MNAAAGPASHNGLAFGKKIFDVQSKIVEHCDRVDALLFALGTLAQIGRGSVMVLIRGGDDFIRDLQSALVQSSSKRRRTTVLFVQTWWFSF